MPKSSVRDTKVLLAVEVTGKMTGTGKSLQKRGITLKTHGYSYILCCEMEVASLCNSLLVSSHEEKLFQLF